MRVNFLVAVGASHVPGFLLPTCVCVHPSPRVSGQPSRSRRCPATQRGMQKRSVSAPQGALDFFFCCRWLRMGHTPSMKAVLCGVVYITPLLASSKSVDVSDFQPSSPLASCHATGYLFRTSAWSICCGNNLQASACKKRASLASGDHAGLGLEAVGFGAEAVTSPPSI